MLVLLSLVLCLLVRSSTGDDNDNYFFYPPASYDNQHWGPTDPLWLIGSTVTLRWTTNLDSYNITLWQQNPNEGRAGPVTWDSIYTKNSGDPEIGQDGFNWTVQTYGLDATSPIPIGSPIFFLVGGQILSQQGAPGFVSYYVNLTNNANDPGLSTATSTASSITATSTSASSSTMRTISTIPTIQASATPTQNPSAVTTTPQTTATGTTSSNELSPGAKAGIGVACGVGIPIVALLAWLAFRREMRSRNLAKASGPGQGDGPPAYSGPNGQAPYAAKELHSSALVEASGEPMRHEMGEGVSIELPTQRYH